LRWGNLRTNVILGAIAKRRRLFNPSACGSAHVKGEFSAIDAGEKILSDQGQQREGQHACTQETNGENLAAPDRSLEDPVIAFPEAVKSLFEPGLHAHERIAGFLGIFSAL